jgi:N-acetylglutamate synthase-like GNAT family acetyltransferase
MSTPARKVSPLEVTRAKLGDEDLIASLILEAFLPFKDEYTAGAFEYTAANADAIRERFAEGPMWIAYDAGEAVGTVSGLPEPDRFYIRSMAVKPAAQKHGVGQKLLDVLEQHAREAEFTRLYLYTTFVLRGAKRLYEKNGFYVVRETLPEEWFDMGGLEMEKKLT